MTINTGTFPYSPCSYDNGIIVQRAADFLESREIENCALVCKLWNVFCNSGEVWSRFFIEHGIPFVEGHDPSMLRKDFNFLYPRCVSGARISRLLGEVVGRPEPICQAIFNKALYDSDPFEDGKLMKETFVFVVEPYLIRRIAGDGAQLDLNQAHNLIELPADKAQSEKELMIPCTFRNLRVLCSLPLEGKENMPVFCYYSDDEVFNQCSASSNKVNVYFMRRCVAEKSRGITYAAQKNYLQERGFEPSPVRIRALFDAVEILESGTCPDSHEPQWTCIRCAETVTLDFDGKVYQASVGAFSADTGLIVGTDYEDDDLGVVPCVPAGIS